MVGSPLTINNGYDFNDMLQKVTFYITL